MPAAKRKGADRNITRLDYARTRGYWVRFEGAHKASRLFSDGVHGGKAKALAEARRFRDAFELTHDLSRRIAPQSLPGPGRIVKRQIYQRKSWSWVWEAYIRLERGKGHAVTRYSIAKWGSAEAKRLCEVWLKKKQKEQKAAYAELGSVLKHPSAVKAAKSKATKASRKAKSAPVAKKAARKAAVTPVRGKKRAKKAA